MVRYERGEDLYPYRYRVASAVGLCSIEIFGYSDPRARDYAVNLGIALQLTNILRDVGADARAGRVYLPQDDSGASGAAEDDLRHGRYSEPSCSSWSGRPAAPALLPRGARAAYPPRRCPLPGCGRDHGRIYFALLARSRPGASAVLRERDHGARAAQDGHRRCAAGRGAAGVRAAEGAA